MQRRKISLLILGLEAVRAAKKIKFVPGDLNGQPVSTLIQLEYNFMGVR
jgi:hypothetical protein